MKRISLLFICNFLLWSLHAQNMIGAWESYPISNAENGSKTVMIFTEGYQVTTTYNASTGDFLKTQGGSWKLEDTILIRKIEFDSEQPETVGTEVKETIKFSDQQLELKKKEEIFNRIDDGEPRELEGAWLMSGRIVDGKTQTRDVNIPRKTMKILSGTRFQWIAYDTDTKQFMATGGGTYTTKDGKYTETIEFFSKNASRVGKSLTFDYNLDSGNWHHRGFSSVGDPLDEVWQRRKSK